VGKQRDGEGTNQWPVGKQREAWERVKFKQTMNGSRQRRVRVDREDVQCLKDEPLRGFPFWRGLRF